MYFIAGLDYSEYWKELAEKRWKIKVHLLQHWMTAYYLRNGVFRLPVPDIPRVKLEDVEKQARALSKYEYIVYGYKSIDSLQRRAWLSKWKDRINREKKLFAPLKDWNNTDVYSYLMRRRIPAPEADKRVSGVDLTPDCMAFFRREWPADYKRILKVFPYAAYQADRAELIRKNKASEV